ncbi:Protein PROTON GRADIENT REGULATION 5, chloroplastic, partial [Cucurbita argyrosperma subsp. sororia]
MEAAATDIPRSGSGRIFNLFVRLLDGKTLALKLTSPSVHGHAIKHRLFETTGIPPNHQRLVTGVRQIEDDSVVSCFDECSGKFPTVHLLLRLLGGKGGFGSLLRGAATKAGQKKTNNFDACRDMSGRRLRHVNAEKRLEEWKAEEEERRLEKVAEEFLKKKSKVGKKGVGDSATQKYVERYREESARCVAEVEKSVRDAVMKGGKGKRKGRSMPNGADAKKLKIWMGKRKMGESDSDDLDSDDSDSEEENEKSVILNDGCQSDLNKDAEGSSDSVNFGKHGLTQGAVGTFASEAEAEAEAVCWFLPIQEDEASKTLHYELPPPCSLNSDPSPPFPGQLQFLHLGFTNLFPPPSMEAGGPPFAAKPPGCSRNRSRKWSRVAKPVRFRPMMKNVNEGKGVFAPAVVLARNIIGKKRFNQLRGKAIALHSQIITEFCKSIGS